MGIDLFLIHEVVSPSSSQYRSKIPLWRYHRRFANDKRGHQFRYIFFSEPEVRNELEESVARNERLQSLVAAGFLRSFECLQLRGARASTVEGASDPSWHPAVQEAWPVYAMGVSLFLESLVHFYFDQELYSTLSSVQEQVRHFRAIRFAIRDLVKRDGQHALLHHLSALLGYDPIHLEKDIVF